MCTVIEEVMTFESGILCITAPTIPDEETVRLPRPGQWAVKICVRGEPRPDWVGVHFSEKEWSEAGVYEWTGLMQSSILMVSELFDRHSYVPAPTAVEVDPLSELDALQEAQLLDCRVSALTGSAAMLFELRTSLQFNEGNAALLVIRGVRAFEWNAAESFGPLMVFSVISSESSKVGGSVQISLGCLPEARLVARGGSAEFYVLDVKGIGEVPPDYTGGNMAAIWGDLPSWSLEFDLLQSSRCG